jgi:hypothetical protein
VRSSLMAFRRNAYLNAYQVPTEMVSLSWRKGGRRGRTFSQEGSCCDDGEADPEAPDYTAKESNELMAEERWERNRD